MHVLYCTDSFLGLHLLYVRAQSHDGELPHERRQRQSLRFSNLENVRERYEEEGGKEEKEKEKALRLSG